MSRFTWIRHLLASQSTPARPRPMLLGLQALEERETPAMFLVTTAADGGAGSLRDAIAQANANVGADTITFAAGLGPVTLTTAQLLLTDTTGATTISGPSGGTQVVRRSTANGTPAFRIFSVNSGVTAHLSHLTITDGRTPGGGDGGGVRNAGNLTVTNSVVSGNGGTVSINGGGLYNFGGTLAVIGSTISGNGGLVDVATNGGGLYNFQGTVTVASSTITGNNAGFDTGSGGIGGGVFNSGGIMTITSTTISGNGALLAGGIQNAGTLTVTNSTVSGNTANNTLGGGGNGGGINNGGTLTLANSTISGNTASNQGGNATGGGLFSNGTLTVTNSTFSGNQAIVSSGGGVSIAGGSATLTNVTITGNRSNSPGGGLSRSGGTATLNNTLIAGNFRGSTGSTRDDVNGAVVSSSSNNLIGDGTGLAGITNGSQGNLIGTGAAPIDPLLEALANNGGPTRTHALGRNSLALARASVSVPGFLPHDQRGVERDAGEADIGAFEVQHPLSPVGVPVTNAELFAPKPSASVNEAFVKGLYQATLLRSPVAGEIAFWVGQLNGGATRSTVALGFVNSPENRTNQVTFFYRYFLSREPDAPGLAFHVDRLRNGTDEGEVMTGFILSPEYSANNDNASFVNLMYYALLGRPADSGGFNFYMDQLANGVTRETIVKNFLRSPEGLDRVVRSFIQTYLKRAATTTELATLRTQLQSGNTFGQVARSILGGDEFFTNAGNNLT